jgi:hypothetical protein
MTVSIIDRLEVIGVENEQGSGAEAPLLFEFQHEALAVEKPRLEVAARFFQEFGMRQSQFAMRLAQSHMGAVQPIALQERVETRRPRNDQRDTERTSGARCRRDCRPKQARWLRPRQLNRSRKAASQAMISEGDFFMAPLERLWTRDAQHTVVPIDKS